MSNGRIFFGILIILIGLSLLFEFPFFKFAFAILVIAFGVRVLVRDSNSVDFYEQTETDDPKLDRVLVFSGINKKFTSSSFEGGEVVAVFGGGEVDLSGAKTKQKEITLEVTAIFGGLKIIVPGNWQVSSEGTGILGGYNNKTKLKGKKAVDVRIKGAAIFGGVEIVN